jgi:HlyD family secretion protein
MKSLRSFFETVRRRRVLSSVVFLVVVGLVIAIAARPKRVREKLNFYEAKRGDVLISVVEGGTIEAVDEEVIRSEVEGIARIIFIVPEGSTVKRGDLIVELDSSAAQDTVNLQQINVERAQFALLQAEQALEIGKSTVESEVQAAQLKLEFAQSDLEKYVKGEAAQQLRNAQIEITNVLENLQINVERLEWTEALQKKGFETKGNLDKDRLAVSQFKLKLEQATKALWMLETFDAPKKKRELEATMQEAREALDRVKLQGDRKLAQWKADVATQKSTLDLSTAKLERDTRQLAATKIYAPNDGLVVYASSGAGRFSSESMIEEGAVVRNRQELIKLPDVSAMKLQVKIHESHINQIARGQQAFVVLDSKPDQRFEGVVNRVAPLPDSSSRWGNPNLKLYATEILITDPLPNVKPGVSARAEILITNLDDVIAVPLQAVTTRGGKPVVFLDDPPYPVSVTVGQYNTKVIEIVSGLKPGDRVLLSPPLDANEKDLGGSVIAPGEEPAALDTNKVQKAFARAAAEEHLPRDGGFAARHKLQGTNALKGTRSGIGTLSSQPAADALRKAVRGDGLKRGGAAPVTKPDAPRSEKANAGSRP